MVLSLYLLVSFLELASAIKSILDDLVDLDNYELLFIMGKSIWAYIESIECDVLCFSFLNYYNIKLKSSL